VEIFPPTYGHVPMDCEIILGFWRKVRSDLCFTSQILFVEKTLISRMISMCKASSCSSREGSFFRFPFGKGFYLFKIPILHSCLFSWSLGSQKWSRHRMTPTTATATMRSQQPPRPTATKHAQGPNVHYRAH